MPVGTSDVSSIVKPDPGIDVALRLCHAVLDIHKVHERLHKIEQARKELVEAIEATTKLGEIDKLHSDAREAQSTANDLLDKARKDAEAMLAKALNQIKEEKAKASSSLAKRRKQVEGKEDDIEAREKSVSEREQFLERAEAGYQDRATRVEALIESNAQLQKTLEDKLAAVKKAAA